MQDLRITFITGMWKRPEVFEMFAKGIEKIQSQWSNMDIQCVVAGSEGVHSRSLCEKYNFYYIETPNQPLARKMNTTVTKAKDLESDYVICLGSDDIIHPDLFAKYLELINDGYDYIGVTDWYFYDTNTKKSLYWGGYKEKWRKGHTCGAGRVLSKWLLDKWDWKIWEDQQSHILDNSMQDKLNNTGHRSYTFSLKKEGLYGLDIKSSTNMTPFKKWDNANYIDTNALKGVFDYVWN